MLKETSAALSEVFQVEGTQHSYRVVRMWEQDPEPLLQDAALLPLATLCRTDVPVQLLTRVAEQVANIETTEERGQIAACTEILAGLRFEKSLIRQLFQEEIMRESVIYQDILRQGQQQALRTSILQALESRFGAVPGNLDEQLGLLTPEQLQGLLRQAWTCTTVEEFISQLADVLDSSSPSSP